MHYIRVFIVSVLAFCGRSALRAAEPAIVEVHTAAADVLVVVVQTGPHVEPGAVDPLDLSPEKWKVNGAAAKAMHRYSIPFDEEKAEYSNELKRDVFRVTVRHRIYLRLKENLKAGEAYTVNSPYGAKQLKFDDRRTFCESIKVNQVGYNKHATSRFANFGIYLGDGGSLKLESPPKYKVIDERTGKAITSGEGKYMGDDTKVAPTAITSGEHVYRLALSDVPVGGPYFVSVAGCGRSRSFGVGDEYSRQIAYVATRGLYHQRCGIALEKPYTEFTRGICHEKCADTRAPWTPGHLKVPAGAKMHRVIGGYHDAGDFDRRPFHTLVPLLMFSYFEAFPTHFVDKQYNIPESGNKIPDFLDEALWGLLVWEQLQVMGAADSAYGGVRMGTEMERHPTYGVHSAANDPGVYGTWEVGVDHTATCAGLFAHASRLIRPHNEKRAEQLLRRASLAWEYVKKNRDERTSASCLLYASLQLYLAGGQQAQHDHFREAANSAIVKGGKWPEQYLAGNTSAKVQTAHFISYLLPHGRDVDEQLAAALRERIFQFADKETYMGPEPEGEPYPQGVTRFMGFGAATAQGRYADVYAFAYQLANDAGKKQRYFNAVAQFGDYSLGLNPIGVSFYTGLGTDQPRSPLHLDSYFTRYGLSDGVTSDHAKKPIGNIPGILLYGATDGRSNADYQRVISDKLFPAFDDLPAQRRWADGWSLVNGNEFTVWETQVWNVVLHGVLYDASRK